MEQNNRNAQYWITLAVSLASLAGSVSFSWIAPVLPKFHNNETDFHLTETEESWFVSSTSPGMVTGALFAQYPSNRLGRRATLLISAFPFILGTTCILAATKAWLLCLGRYCWGCGCGMIQSVIMIYIVEISSKEIRGKLTAANRLIFNTGGFLVLVTGSMVSYPVLSWALFVLPVCYFIACWLVPETPYFLLKQGKVDEAGKTLMKLNGFKDEKILAEQLEEMHSHVKQETQRSGSFKELVTGKQYRRALVVSVGLTLTRLLTGSVAMKQYVGRILQETSSDLSLTTGLIIFGTVRFLSSFCTAFLLDKVGRRPLLLISFIVSTILLAILGGYFYMENVMNTTPPYFGYVNLICNVLLCLISTLGYDTIGFILPAELFPLNVKAKAMTYLNLIMYMTNFTTVRGYQIIKDYSGLHGVFWFFGFASFVGTVFTWVLVPETKGKSLREIQEELQGKHFIDIATELNNAKELHTIENAEEMKPLKS